MPILLFKVKYPNASIMTIVTANITNWIAIIRAPKTSITPGQDSGKSTNLRSIDDLTDAFNNSFNRD